MSALACWLAPWKAAREIASLREDQSFLARALADACAMLRDREAAGGQR